MTNEELVRKIEATGHSTAAVTDNGEANGKLLGIITERDFRIDHCPAGAKVQEYMTVLGDLVKAETGITLEEAKEILGKARKEKLPIVDDNFNLKGLITIKDIEKAMMEGYSTAPDNIRSLGFGAGMGLPNMKRYTDSMTIDSVVGEGTCIEMTVNL